VSPQPRRPLASAAAGPGAAAARRKEGPNPVTVAAIALLVILAFCYWAFAKRIPFVHGYQVQGIFQSSNQVRKGSPVRMAGVDVGKVTGFGNGPGTTQIVKMELKDAALPLHTDATFRIRPRLFLEGGFYVEMSPGSPSAPVMDSGGTVPLSNTSTPVQFHQVLGALNRPVRDSLKEMLFGLSDALDKGGAQALGRSMKPLAPALRDIAIVNDAARGVRPHDLSDLVRGLSRVTAALARNDDQLADLVTGLRRATGALASESDGLRASLRELDAVLAAAPPALTAVDGALPSVRTLTAELRPSLRLSPPVLRQAGRVLDQLAALVRAQEAPRLLANLKPGLLRLPTLERRLQELFPLVTPVTDCVRDNAVPVLNAKLDDGPHSTNRPVWQELGPALVGLLSSSQDFDGNGVNVRYMGSGGDASVTLQGGQLVGRTDLPFVGVSPRWLGPGLHSPFRPDQECRDQAPVNLQSRVGGAPMAAAFHSAPVNKPKSLTPAQLERLIKRVQAEAKAKAAR
jgi:phospholipid/cholesterol/gamma-HCH transport system substrate-binding protein